MNGLSQKQSFETYENADLGFTIDHPAGWKVQEFDLDESTKSQEILKPSESLLNDVEISAPEVTIEGVANGNPIVPASLKIWVFEPKEEKYLDPNDMMIKSRMTPQFTSQELVNGWITYNTNFWGGLFEKVSENETALGVGNYSAARVDAMNHIGDGSYNTAIYSIHGGKMYGIQSSMNELSVPEYLPIIEQMIDSFHITQAVNTTQNKISPELDCDQYPDAERCVQDDNGYAN